MRARWALALILLAAAGAWLWSSRPEADDPDSAAPDGAREQGTQPSLKGSASAAEAAREKALGERASDEARSREPSLAVHVEWPDGKVEGRTAQVTVRMGGERVWRKATDVHGWARFEKLSTGRADIEVRAEPALHGRAMVLLHPGADAWETVNLERDVHVRGRVLARATGRPIAGALLYAVKGQRGWAMLRAGQPSATADAAGRYDLVCPPLKTHDAWADYTVVAIAPGFEAVLYEFPRVEGLAVEVALEVRLEPGGTARGTVRDPAGAAVPRARVAFLPQGDASAREDPWGVVHEEVTASRLLTGVTDARGRYVIHGLAFGAVYAATATAKGYARGVDSEDLEVTAARSEVAADLQVRTGCTLLLQILDEEGAEEPEVMVSVDEGSASHPDSHGRWRVDDLAPGVHRVTVWAHHLEMQIHEDVDVGRGGLCRHEIRLPETASIRGVLVDEAGRPVRRASLHAEALSGGGLLYGHADEEGAFHLTSAVPGPYRLQVQWGPGLVTTGDGIEVVAPAKDVRFVVVRPGRVRLWATFPEDADAPNRLWAWEPDGEPQRWGIGDLYTDGWYVFEMPPGTHTWIVSAEGFAPRRIELRVRSDQDLEIKDVAFEEGRRLSGRVVDEAGRSVAPVTVSAVDHVGSRKTTHDGTILLEHLWREDVILRVEAPGYLPVDHLHRAGAEGPVRIVLTRRGGVVSGRTLDARGRGLAAETVYLRAEGGLRSDATTWSATSDAKGRFECRVPPGRYDVSVKRKERHVVLATVGAEEGGRHRVDVQVPPR